MTRGNARGSHPDAGPVSFEERHLSPAPRLRGLVRSYIDMRPVRAIPGIGPTVAAPSQSLPWRILPEATGNVILHVFNDGRPSCLGLVGARSVFADIDRGGRVRSILVHLQPGALRRLFGIPAHEATDRSIDLLDLWGTAAHELRDALTSSTRRGRVSESVAHLDRALTARLSGPAAPPPLVGQALTRLLRDPARPSVRALAADLGVTDRTLRRALLDHTGLGPKRLARVARVRRSLRLAESRPETSWAEVAARAGYCDQSHLIAEYHGLLGDTPRGYLARSNRE